jgi:rhomboid protease GluP
LGARIFEDSERLIKVIIGANIAMFLVSLVLSGRGVHLSSNPMALLAPNIRQLLALGATGTIPIHDYHRWWTLICASYLHGGLLHIIFNMLAFRQIALLIAQLYGPHRMLAIYTLGGAGGFLLSTLAGVSTTIGASAAVCSLIGAALYYGKSRGGVFGQAVYRQVSGWVLGIVVLGFLIPGINNWAHGGGIAAGILFSLLLGYRERALETAGHRLLGSLCLYGTAIILVWAVVTTLAAQYKLS